MKLKKELREKLLKERHNFDEFKFFEENEKIICSIKDIFDSLFFDLRKKTNKPVILGLYWPLKGEPDLIKLALEQQGKVVGLPKINGHNMKYVQYNPGAKIEKSGFGEVMQPQNNVEIIPQIVIIPGLAYSLNGYRLGFGIGHYDRYLSLIKKDSNPITIGVCFDDYLFEYLPMENHDVRFDYIVTEKTIIKT